MMGFKCRCSCGCNLVNFKAFDFSNGTLLWEKLLDSPLIGLSGDIYSIHTTELAGNAFSTTTKPPGGGHGTASLKDYAELLLLSGTLNEFRILRSDKLTGVDVTLGDPVSFNESTVPPFMWGSDFHSSWRHLDDSHQFVGYTNLLNGPGVTILQRADPGTSGKITYYIDAMTQDETIRMVTASGAFGAALTIDFATDDTIAAIETTISMALGARATVSTSGFPPKTGFLQIVITWADADDHFDTATVNARQGHYSQLSLIDSATGGLTTASPVYTTSPFFAGNFIRYDAATNFIFSQNGELLAFGKYTTPAPFTSTVERLFSVDVSTAWAKSWETEREQSGVTGQDFTLVYAKNGMVVMTAKQPATQSSVVPGHTQVVFIEQDGTNRTSIVGYMQGLAPVAILDDTANAVIRTLWDYTYSIDVTFDAADQFFGAGFPSSLKTINTATGATIGHYEAGEAAGPFYWNNPNKFVNAQELRAAADSTAAAFITSRAYSSLENTYGTHTGDLVILSSREDDYGGLNEQPSVRCQIHQERTTTNQGGTGAIADQPNIFYVHEFIMVPPGGFNMGSTQPRWKLRWVNNSGSATIEETGWFNYTDNETTVNTELLSVWGVNNLGGPNCELSGASIYNDAGLGEDLVIPQMPFWCQQFIVHNYGPHASEGYTGRGGSNPTEQPEVFDNISTVRLQLLVENPATFSSGSISVMDFSDGQPRWSRNFSKAGRTAVKPYEIALSSAVLYSRGPELCGELTVIPY